MTWEKNHHQAVGDGLFGKGIFQSWWSAQKPGHHTLTTHTSTNVNRYCRKQKLLGSHVVKWSNDICIVQSVFWQGIAA